MSGWNSELRQLAPVRPNGYTVRFEHVPKIRVQSRDSFVTKRSLERHIVMVGVSFLRHTVREPVVISLVGDGLNDALNPKLRQR